jgi:hypothetical protein
LRPEIHRYAQERAVLPVAAGERIVSFAVLGKPMADYATTVFRSDIRTSLRPILLGMQNQRDTCKDMILVRLRI